MADGPGTGQSADQKTADAKLKVFVSYSRDDVAFADQLVAGLEHSGFDPILDRHDIDAAENWKERLGGLILSCDSVVFVLTDKSAGSPICKWEVDEARRAGKRIVPVAPKEVSASAPDALADLNWIHFYAAPAIPGSGMLDGMRKLDHALRVDLAWMREQTRLTEQATLWRTRGQRGAQTPADSSLLLRGQALEDALEWARRTPAGSEAPLVVSQYLEASAANEARLKAEVQAGLAEREAALKKAEEAAAGRAKAQRRLRVFGLVALAVGFVLSAAALAGGWFAAQNYVASNEARSELFAREANARWKESDAPKAMLMALYGDPAAQAGWVEGALRPAGYSRTRSALARAYTSNPLEFAILGHGAYVSALAVDTAGKRMLVGLSTGEVSVWLIGSDKPLGRVMADTRAIEALAFHPDGQRVLIALKDEVKLWRIGEDKPQPVIKGEEGEFRVIAFHPDGLRFLTGSPDGVVKLWQIGQQTPLASFAHMGIVTSIASHPDGQRFLVGAEHSPNGASAATLWRIGEAAPLATFPADEYGVYSLAFHPDGQRVLIGSGRSARLWRIDTKESLAHFDGGHSAIITSVGFSRDGQQVRTADVNGHSAKWRIDSGARLETFDPPDGEADIAVLHPDGDHLLIGSGCCGAGNPFSVKVWRLADENHLATFAGHKNDIWSLALHPDGMRFLTGSWDGTAKLWRIGEDKPLATFSGHKGEVASVAFHPDGERFLTASYDGTVKLWRIGQTGPLETFTGHTDLVYSVAFHPDGQRFLTGSADGTARLWRIGEDKPLETFEGHKDGVWAVAFHPDGERFLTASDDSTAKLWRIGQKQPLQTFKGHGGGLTSVAFHPDGERFLTGSWDDTAKLWRIGEDKPLASFPHGGIVWSVAFHPDGERFLTGAGLAVALWRIGEENPLAVFVEHRGDVTAIAVHPDGKRFLTASRDDTAMLWAMPAIELASAKDQVAMACKTLKTVGAMEFSEEDYQGFPILDRKTRHPCATAWGFDPRVRREAEEAATAKVSP